LISHPLVVDLDGTLVHTDMLHETALRIVRDHPWQVLWFTPWLARGKAFLKERVARSGKFDPKHLPYNQELLQWLAEQKQAGRKLVLCTASDQRVAESIAAHLGIFDEVMASNGTQNLGGRAKAESLIERYGDQGFDYIGNSKADLKVWKHARRAILVNASRNLVRQASKQFEIEREFPAPARGIGTVARTLRMHQWMKNLLLFVPILAAHQVADVTVWTALLIAFASFSLCASSVYIFNDLLDLESDRAHPRKRHRPFASGAVPVLTGVVAGTGLLAASLVFASWLEPGFHAWLGVYFLLTCAYSWVLKRLMLVDCLSLAALYTVRIVAGAAAVGLALSFWLLAFSVFLFLSLAFVKRYAELEVQLLSGNTKAHGRGYYTSDAPLVQTLGVTAGYGAVLVLALYLNSDTVLRMYRTPELVWGAVPVLLFWISWMWMKAHRGEMHDDPLVFAVKDKVSLVTGAVFGAVVLAGAIGLPGT
jgi:4-hydroxybenzoate polyprenyltransferase/phosphoserine phosphatase